jgi:hypothetical protein
LRPSQSSSTRASYQPLTLSIRCVGGIYPFTNFIYDPTCHFPGLCQMHVLCDLEGLTFCQNSGLPLCIQDLWRRNIVACSSTALLASSSPRMVHRYPFGYVYLTTRSYALTDLGLRAPLYSSYAFLVCSCSGLASSWPLQRSKGSPDSRTQIQSRYGSSISCGRPSAQPYTSFPS